MSTDDIPSPPYSLNEIEFILDSIIKLFNFNDANKIKTDDIVKRNALFRIKNALQLGINALNNAPNEPDNRHQLEKIHIKLAKLSNRIERLL